MKKTEGRRSCDTVPLGPAFLQKVYMCFNELRHGAIDILRRYFNYIFLFKPKTYTYLQNTGCNFWLVTIHLLYSSVISGNNKIAGWLSIQIILS
jgi:hypothetical protein